MLFKDIAKVCHIKSIFVILEKTKTRKHMSKLHTHHYQRLKIKCDEEKLTDKEDSLIFCSTISRAQKPSSRKVKPKSAEANEVMITIQKVNAKETAKTEHIARCDPELQSLYVRDEHVINQTSYKWCPLINLTYRSLLYRNI